LTTYQIPKRPAQTLKSFVTMKKMRQPNEQMCQRPYLFQ
jgi:hypothetical protein